MTNIMSIRLVDKIMRNKINGLKAEWKKIIWPDRYKLIKKTAAVIVTCLAVGIVIVAVDLFSQYSVNFITSLFTG